MKFYQCTFPNSERLYTYQSELDFEIGEQAKAHGRDGSIVRVEVQRQTEKPKFECKEIFKIESDIAADDKPKPRPEFVPPVGHNRPPSDEEILKERLAEAQRPLLERLKAIASRKHLDVETIDLDNAEAASAFTVAIKDLAHLKKDMEAQRVETKKPYLSACQSIDGWGKEMVAKADELRKQLEPKLAAHLEAKELAERQRLFEEEERLRKEAAEAAERERKEAAELQAEAFASDAGGVHDTAQELMTEAQHKEQAADMIERHAQTAKPSQLAKSRHSAGNASASTSNVWVGELDSKVTLDLEPLRHYFTNAELEKAIRAYVRDGGRQLRGAKIYQTSKLNVR